MTTTNKTKRSQPSLSSFATYDNTFHKAYHVLEKIDFGAYADVFRATDLKRNKTVAIKRVQCANIRSNYTNHPCIEIKILEEFRSHEHFPTLHQVLYDKSSGSYSIIMDYFEHQPFSSYNTKLNQQQTIKYMKTLIQCVSSLSDKGFLHRDIKPSNVLYNPCSQKLMLIDFGLCQERALVVSKYKNEQKLINGHQKHKNKYKQYKAQRSSISNSKSSNKNRKIRRSDVYTGNVQLKPVTTRVIRDGTPGFRAPEIVLGSNYQYNIDIFSVGIILSHIIMGGLWYNPISDYDQLVKFVTIYGLRKVMETADRLDRKLQIRGITRQNIYMNNGSQSQSLNSGSYVTGYESHIQHKSKMSYWIKKRREHVNMDKCKDNNDNCEGTNDDGMSREWSEDIYDLLDKLTEFDPFQRVTPTEALQHKLFSSYS